MTKTTKVLALGAASLALFASVAQPLVAQEDTRELVELPPMMQTHLLESMRDHMSTINDILAALAEGDVDTAAAEAESRLGMSSLTKHGGAHLAQFYPQGMQDIGTQMHHAASQFTIIVKDEDFGDDPLAQQKIFQALQNITENCNACHQSYRIR